MKKIQEPALGQKETAKHGDAFFPIQKYITLLTPDHPVVTTHWHEEAEFTLITRNCGRSQINLCDYPLKEKDLVFIPPLLLHSFSKNQESDFQSETYVFHLNFLGGNSTDICSTRYLMPLTNQELTLPYLIQPAHPSYASLLALFKDISRLYQHPSYGYELALKGRMLQVVSILLQYSTKTPLPDAGEHSEKLKLVLDYIELHYPEPIFISDLAKLCYFSDYHFMRFFKKHMNMTCLEYINSLRLEKSVKLLEQGNASILEISLSVGFRNLSYFHRAFKKKYHMTPLSFQKQMKNFP